MENLYYIIAGISFVASFVFSMGGVGTATIMVPVLVSFGIPLNVAKSTALFNNSISMMGASISNFRNGRLDFKFSIPFILSSVVFASVGAYSSKYFSTEIILTLFIIFLVVSGLMFLFLGKKEDTNYREDSPFLLLFLVGTFAGFLAGLIGIGGGSVISPIMLMLGFNPKKTTTVTASVIPFSAFSGFLTYWIMGNINWVLIGTVSFFGILGASLGTSFMHKKLNPKAVKKVLAFVLLGMAAKMILKII